MDNVICQSCSMVISSNELFGTEINGDLSEEYCKYCYTKGNFNNPKETMEEMIDSCIPFEIEDGLNEKEARNKLEKTIPMLKRWINN